jgi:type II secretory pathway pseudopilin PulG
MIRRHHSHRRISSQRGVLLVEILLAVAIFGMISLVVISAFTYGREGTSIAGDNSRAAEVASTAVEAVQNIAQSSYSNLSSYTNGTTYYLNASSTQWTISTTPTTINGIYTPSLVFSNGPGTSRQVTINVGWKANAQRNGLITTTTYLSNWQTATAATIKTGLLVYANGGTTTSLITYRQLQSNGLWTSPLPLPSVGAANRVARSVKLYSAQTGTKKVVIARFADGTKQYVYGFPWTGTAWVTPQLLASWTSNTALDSGNFSGTYLANGTFITTYNDNSNKPKYNSFDGTSWSAQGSLPAITADTTDTPTSMVIKARPGTNEAMLALLGNDYESLSSYYSNGAFAPFTLMASNNNSNSTHDVDFDWSKASGGIYGLMVYTLGNGQRTPTIRIFTADNLGSGTWGTEMKSTDQPAGSIVISVAVSGQPSGSPNFLVCDKDNSSHQRIYCYTATPTSISVPTNPILAPSTAPGGQQTMDLGFEDQVGSTGLAGYADGTSNAGIKRWLSATNTWDANPISTPPAASATDKTRLIPEPGLNDAMLLQIDSQNNLYSIMYNGNSSAYYTTPTGYSWTIHNANGPSVGAKWFDFGWDN